MKKRKTRVLFLCTGNACRSQMAQGWAKKLGDGVLEARSAGIEAHGLNSRSIAVMAEAGVDISGQHSARLTQEMLQWADIVITVCSHAEQQCPLLPVGITKRHWPLEDPAKASGTEEEVMAVFRAIRNEIKHLVTELLDDLMAQHRSDGLDA